MPGGRSYASTMGETKPSTALPEKPPIDPDAVRREYHRQRALRKARVERKRRARRAGARFWVVLLLLVVVAVVIALSTWRQIGDLFGL